MGKKDKKKGTPFGYLMMLLGLAVAALGVTLAISVDDVVNIAKSVPVLKEQYEEGSVQFGMIGAGVVLFLLGMVIRPKKKKKK